MAYSEFLLMLQQQPQLLRSEHLEEIAMKLKQRLKQSIHRLTTKKASSDWLKKLTKYLRIHGYQNLGKPTALALPRFALQFGRENLSLLTNETAKITTLILHSECFNPSEICYLAGTKMSWQAWLERQMAENQINSTIWGNETQFGVTIIRRNGQTWTAKLDRERLSSFQFSFALTTLSSQFNEQQNMLLDHVLATASESTKSLSDCLSKQLPEALKILVAELPAEQVQRLNSITSSNMNKAGLVQKQQDSVEQNILQSLLHQIVVLLLRTVFCIYAENHWLLPVDNPIYAQSYSLTNSEQQQQNADFCGLWERTLSLFRLVYSGSQHPSLRLPGYYGDLFNPDKTPIFKHWRPTDRAWMKVLDLLQFDLRRTSPKKLNWLNYDPECLGQLYQVTLNYFIVFNQKARSLQLTSQKLQRQTGTFYTPRNEAQVLVKETLLPLVYDEEGQLKSARRLLELKICDFAAGSGALLVEAARQLADYLVESWREQQKQLGNSGFACLPYGETMTELSDQPIPFQHLNNLQNCARRLVVERCIYGVDINPTAIEIAKMSLWLLTAAKNKALSFVDHAVVVGDSLLGLISKQLFRADIPLIKNRIPLFQQNLADRLFDARTIREELQQILVLDNDQIVLKQKLLQQSCAALEPIQNSANTIIETWVHNPSELEDQIAKLLSTPMTEQSSDSSIPCSLSKSLESTPIHWPLRFPEVFKTGESDHGFDAVIANPPFCGTRRLNKFVGKNYHHYLKTALASKPLGGLDLCLFFLYRAAQIVKPRGVVGFLTTSSLVEGRNRTLGLKPFLNSGWRIIHAVTQFNWPGAAHLDVCLIHLSRQHFKIKPRLDGFPVRSISSRLDGLPEMEPKNLKSLLPVHAFQGSSPGTQDFVVESHVALDWLKQNPKNNHVLKPYLRGQTLQQSAEIYPSDWIIDFRDKPKREALNYCVIFQHLQSKISKNRKQPSWWRHTNYRPKLYKELQYFNSTIVKARISPWHVFEIVPADWCFADGLIVIPSDDYLDLAIYQSSVHELWTRHFSSKLQRSCRYTIQDAFETFPRPEATLETEDSLRFLIKKLLNQRRLAQASKNCSLSHIYRQINQQIQLDPVIEVIRVIHDQIDELVLKAYQWDDIKFNYQYKTDAGNPIRTLEKTQQIEILSRLLQRNLTLSSSLDHKLSVIESFNSTINKKRCMKVSGSRKT